MTPEENEKPRKQIQVKKVNTPADLEKVFEIRRQVFVVEQNCPPEIEWEFEEESTHFLATVNGEPAGASRWRKTDKGYKLERFAVLSSYRGGVGKALVQAVLNDLPADADYVYMHAQLAAVGLYEKFGFEKNGPQFEEAGIQHYKMIRKQKAQSMENQILAAFGLDAQKYQIQNFGTGLINHTWKVSGEKSYILQRINKSVFKKPEQIAENIDLVAGYLKEHYPAYLFIAPAALPNDDSMLLHSDGEYYRLMPFVEGSYSFATVDTADEAFEAAKQFGLFSALLSDFDSSKLNYTLVDFHNLTLRYSQLQPAIQSASAERLEKAANAITLAEKYKDINDTYRDIIAAGKIPLRVMHHDTKISNVLFDAGRKGLCVVDLDTIMPGYLTSDLGDMMRTYLSPAGEEEKELHKVCVRPEIFKALVEGYFAEMGSILTPLEKDLVVYSGKFMIYMQAIRFLVDYLNNDIYYGSKYPGHNLVRAENQFTLLEHYVALEKEFKAIVSQL